MKNKKNERNETKRTTGEATYAGGLRPPRAGSPARGSLETKLQPNPKPRLGSGVRFAFQKSQQKNNGQNKIHTFVYKQKLRVWNGFDLYDHYYLHAIYRHLFSTDTLRRMER